MCLIIVKKKGVSLNASFLFSSLYKSAVKNNSGFGYAFKRDNMIRLSKGHKTLTVMIDEIKKFGVRTNDEWMIHLRNPSPGTEDNPTMSHPFVISSDPNVLKKSYYYGKVPVFSHNGRIGYDIIPTIEANKNSDSYAFVKNILSQNHMLDIMNLLYRNKNLNVLYKKLFGTDKFAIIRPKYSVTMFGEWEESEGLFFSNDSYKIPTIPRMVGFDYSKAYEGN